VKDIATVEKRVKGPSLFSGYLVVADLLDVSVGRVRTVRKVIWCEVGENWDGLAWGEGASRGKRRPERERCWSRGTKGNERRRDSER
jgi:hypothetical protein